MEYIIPLLGVVFTTSMILRYRLFLAKKGSRDRVVYMLLRVGRALAFLQIVRTIVDDKLPFIVLIVVAGLAGVFTRVADETKERLVKLSKAT